MKLTNKIIGVLFLILVVLIGFITYKITRPKVYHTQPGTTQIMQRGDGTEEKTTIDISLVDSKCDKVGYLVSIEKSYHYQTTLTKDTTKYTKWLVGRDLQMDIWYKALLGYDLHFIKKEIDGDTLVLTLESAYLNVKAVDEDQEYVKENQNTFLAGHFTPEQTTELRKLGKAECINAMHYDNQLIQDSMENLKSQLTDLFSSLPYKVRIDIIYNHATPN